MTYYKVNPQFDNKRYYYTIANTRKRTYGGILVANELLTPRERNKIPLSDEHFTIVDVNPRKTYFFFGARFEL